MVAILFVILLVMLAVAGLAIAVMASRRSSKDKADAAGLRNTTPRVERATPDND